MADSSIHVRDNPESRTYEAWDGDSVVGSLVYELEGPRTVLTHTWVEPSQREAGVGTALTRGALDDLRAKGRRITVYCTFVADFIAEHSEYADLIDPEHPGTPRHV
jgi:uncharacterized protein